MKNYKNPVLKWISEICPGQDIQSSYVQSVDSKKGVLILVVFSHDFRYMITATKKHLDCFVSNRKPRAGLVESQSFGLAGGPVKRETWDKIKDAIIKYELVKISRRPKVNKG